MPQTPLYDRDFYAWANEQAALLRDGKVGDADIEHIAQEIESMGKTEKRELASGLTLLMLHLLKWKFQSSKRTPSWEASIKVRRDLLADHLEDNPSLKPLIPAVTVKSYKNRGRGGRRGDGPAGVDVPKDLPLVVRPDDGPGFVAGRAESLDAIRRGLKPELGRDP